MSVTFDQVKRVAKLARIKVTEEEMPTISQELNGILNWIEQLNQVDVSGVENYCDLPHTPIPERPDVVTDGNITQALLANAPESAHSMFAVPKVVE